VGFFRFRRSFGFGLFRLNLNKKSVSLTAGVRGAHVTLNSGGIRTTLGIPGTGLSYTDYRKFNSNDNSNPEVTQRPRLSVSNNAGVALGLLEILKRGIPEYTDSTKNIAQALQSIPADQLNQYFEAGQASTFVEEMRRVAGHATLIELADLIEGVSRDMMEAGVAPSEIALILMPLREQLKNLEAALTRFAHINEELERVVCGPFRVPVKRLSTAIDAIFALEAQAEPKRNDYERLRAHLAVRKDQEFYMSKSDMEKVLHRSLPKSADLNQYWANIKNPAYRKPVQQAIADSGFEVFITSGSWPLVFRPKTR
jgi:hypothetical protein